jgi:hypothetical protein
MGFFLLGGQSTPGRKALEDEPTRGATTAFRVASEVGELATTELRMEWGERAERFEGGGPAWT